MICGKLRMGNRKCGIGNRKWGIGNGECISYLTSHISHLISTCQKIVYYISRKVPYCYVLSIYI